ncbi:hypothetical protein [Methylobacterium durans]|uniref:Uncharacterized protein n=1 Tax=Methylobacterium durans TaxID=2202825 RepID=A0A2U8WBZ1_9HYPH|nr:hypothetical protein [Methylobacterium durans]AWN43138.1 hypothetical protein DK389_24900 [Methylobacterium durans]
MRRGYGVMHDDAIREGVENGLTTYAIGCSIGASHAFVYKRGVELGLRDRIATNAYVNRAAASRRPKQRPAQRLRVMCKRQDATASALVRRLRARPVDADALSEHAVACFHEAGLTLVDLEDCLGIPPAHAVAAIRRAAEARV